MLARTAVSTATVVEGGGTRPDRRARRRQETIDEILGIAIDVMSEDGVNGLSLAEVARRLGVQPPSLYKYFDSLMAVYDTLFRRGQVEHLQVMRQAMDDAGPGLDALTAGLEASGRWLLENRAVAQLLFWRPVPAFEPSPEALAPSIEMVAMQRRALSDAVAAGQLGPDADSDEAVNLVSTLIAGVLSQTMANEPGAQWGQGRFTPTFPKLMELLPAAYPPRPAQSRARKTTKERRTAEGRSGAGRPRATD
jgi:AcrR family transcriptional regulator